MKKLLLGLLATSGICMAVPAMAADYVPPEPAPAGYFYGSFEGTYVLGDDGKGIQSGNGVIGGDRAKADDGFWISGHLGYVMPSGWDIRLGFGYADLSAGKTVGPAPSNEFGVDDEKMITVDAEAGYVFDLGEGSTVRPFFGIRYLQFKQDTGYHPDVPLGCCSMDSKFDGFGPRVGIEGAFAIADPIKLVGGADVSVLFGDIDFDGGTLYVPGSGKKNRTVFTAGGYLGFDFAITENVSFGAKYRAMYLDGASWDNAGLFVGPSGKGTNFIHGPTASLSFRF